MNVLEDTPLAGEAMASLLGLHWCDGQRAVTPIKDDRQGPVTASGHGVCSWVGLGPRSEDSFENTGFWKESLLH